MTDSPDPATNGAPAATSVAEFTFPVELIIIDYYGRQSQCLVASLPAVLGRDEKDNVRLTDPWISHSHCELFPQGDVLVVRDLDSKNGVFMHGVRIREAEVLPGDCLTLGRTEIVLHYGRASASGNAAADDTGSASASPPKAARRPISGGPTTEELLY